MLIADIKSGDKVLELGCGTGYYTKELAKTNADITAIDISQGSCWILAIKNIKGSSVKFLVKNAYETKFPGSSLGFIVGS